jgi:hypothetical protein
LVNDFTTAASNTGPPDPKTGSTAGGAQVGIGGAIDVHYWNNDVEATIGDASINQDTGFNSPDQNPAQALDVEAGTTWDNIGLDGTVDLNLGFVGAVKNLAKGAQGSKAEVSAAIDINVMSNTTLAQIASGAHIHIAPTGSLKVNATLNILDISLNQSGASAGDVGFAGTIVWNNIVNSTIAQIQDGVFVNNDPGDKLGGPVTVTATDTTDLIGVAGGVATSTHLGYGFTLAVNNLERTTLALIGSNPLTSGGATPTAGAFNVASVDDEADEMGVILSVTFSAASSSPTPPTPPQAQDDDPVQSISSFLADNSEVAPPAAKTGVGAAGAVSVNVIRSTTDAGINDTGIFTVGGQVTVKADSNTGVAAIGGALGQSEQDTGNNVGFGGSLGVNELASVTDAFIYGANITANALTVNAIHEGRIGAFSAGAASTTPGGKASTAMAGSFAINLILPDTEAYLSNTQIALVGDSSVEADENALIVSIAGAAGISGGTGGYGVAIAVNMIGSPLSNGAPANPDLVPDQPALPVEQGAIHAFITNSTITMVGGTLSVTANNGDQGNGPLVVAVTGALGTAEGSTSTGAAGMVSVNLIRDDTEAYIDGGSRITEVTGATDPGPLSLNVNAIDSSGIVALGGAVGVGQTRSVGAALGYNQITSTIKADVENSTVTLTGSVSVTAGSKQTIGGVDVGVAAGTGKGWAAAGSVLVNVISNTIDAHIANNSNVSAGGDVLLRATDTSLIVAIAGAVAASVSGTQGIGASISYNRISNGIAAYIDGSTVTTSGGSISVLATSTPTLVALGAAGAGGAGGDDKSISGAGTLTINSVANTVDAHIIGSPDVHASGDVAVNSSEAASAIVVALTGAGSGTGSAIGASIAYNYIGGLAPLDPNVISYQDGVVPGTVTPTVTADNPIGFDTSIHFSSPTNLNTGDEVLYQAGGGSSIDGLVDGHTYYVIVIDPNTIKLASSEANAMAGIALPLSSQGSSAAQTLTKLDPTHAVTLNPSNNSIADNQINLVSVTQNQGILTITSNGPSFAVTGGDGSNDRQGTTITIQGSVHAAEIDVNGGSQADNVLIDMSAAGSTLVGPARILGGGGGDIITIKRSTAAPIRSTWTAATDSPR